MARIKIVIIGATGKIGEACYRWLNSKDDYDIMLLTSSPDEAKIVYEDAKIAGVDYSKHKELRQTIYNFSPYIIINAVAYTDVDGCENNKALAQSLNTDLVENLVKATKINNYHLITFSSDYIFDGESGPYSETDAPNPINYYGKTKLAAENIITTSNINYTIIRTNVVYGFSSFNKHDFVNWAIDELNMGKNLNIVESQWANPTFADDIARAIEKIIIKGRTGIYHIAGSDWDNRYNLTNIIAKANGSNISLVKPLADSNLKQAARRPYYGGLVSLKAETDLNMKFMGLENGISSMKFKTESYRLKRILNA